MILIEIYQVHMQQSPVYVARKTEGIDNKIILQSSMIDPFLLSLKVQFQRSYGRFHTNGK